MLETATSALLLRCPPPGSPRTPASRCPLRSLSQPQWLLSTCSGQQRWLPCPQRSQLSFCLGQGGERSSCISCPSRTVPPLPHSRHSSALLGVPEAASQGGCPTVCALTSAGNPTNVSPGHGQTLTSAQVCLPQPSVLPRPFSPCTLPLFPDSGPLGLSVALALPPVGQTTSRLRRPDVLPDTHLVEGAGGLAQLTLRFGKQTGKVTSMSCLWAGATLPSPEPCGFVRKSWRKSRVSV